MGTKKQELKMALINFQADELYLRAELRILQQKYCSLLKSQIEMVKDARRMRDALSEYGKPCEEVAQALAWFEVRGWDQQEGESLKEIEDWIDREYVERA